MFAGPPTQYVSVRARRTAGFTEKRASTDCARSAPNSIRQVSQWAFALTSDSVRVLDVATRHDGHSTDHQDRLAYVQARWPSLHSDYHILQNVSFLARYHSNSDFFAQFQPDDVRGDLVTGDSAEQAVVGHACLGVEDDGAAAGARRFRGVGRNTDKIPRVSSHAGIPRRFHVAR